MTSPEVHDPTLVREQPALTTSTGRIWLIVGALLAAVAVVVLGMLTTLDPLVGPAGIVLVVVLYGAMIVVRLTVTQPRRRLALMAIAMLGIAAVSLTCVGIVAASQWESLGP